MYMKKLRAILLIDDDSIFMWFTKTLLERLEVVEQVECLQNAQTALDYLAKLSSYGERMKKDCPDIIFLDLSMPGVDGFKFLEKLQEIKDCRDVPKRIVALTSSMNEEDMQKALNFGISGYLVKPLTETKAINVIKTFQKAV